MNRAVLVLGPESSGTRMVTEILINAGCVGSSDHVQPWDVESPSDDVEIAVWRRSIPHAGDALDLRTLIGRMGRRAIDVVTTYRSSLTLVESQIRNGHADSIQKANDNIVGAYRSLWDQIVRHSPFVANVISTSYESFLLEPVTAQVMLLKILDLEAPNTLVRIKGLGHGV